MSPTYFLTGMWHNTSVITIVWCQSGWGYVSGWLLKNNIGLSTCKNLSFADKQKYFSCTLGCVVNVPQNWPNCHPGLELLVECCCYMKSTWKGPGASLEGRKQDLNATFGSLFLFAKGVTFERF